MKVSHTDDTVTITKDGKLVTEYRTDSKSPYLYPISPPSGVNVTRHWPINEVVAGEEKDHPHHRSFWMSHGAVNGSDFWAWTGKNDARIIHLKTSATQSVGDSASFAASLAWTVDGKTLLSENRSIEIRDLDAQTRIIDTTSKLSAIHEDVVFGDTKEGFFALRVDRSLRLKGATAKGGIINQQGDKDAVCWGKRSPWVAFHGPDETGHMVTIAMMDHRSNLRHPTWWHARDYGLLAANPFGIHDFEGKAIKSLGNYTLKKGDLLTFRYRLLLFQGLPDIKRIDFLWTDFNKS